MFEAGNSIKLYNFSGRVIYSEKPCLKFARHYPRLKLYLTDFAHMFPGSRASPTTIFFYAKYETSLFFFWIRCPNWPNLLYRSGFDFKLPRIFSRKKAGAPFLNGNERIQSVFVANLASFFFLLECTLVSQTSIVSRSKAVPELIQSVLRFSRLFLPYDHDLNT